MNEIVSVECLG